MCVCVCVYVCVCVCVCMNMCIHTSVAQVKFRRVPPVMMVALKRFGSRGAKINRHVSFPAEFSLAPHLTATASRASQVRYKQTVCTRWWCMLETLVMFL